MDLAEKIPSPSFRPVIPDPIRPFFTSPDHHAMSTYREVHLEIFVVVVLLLAVQLTIALLETVTGVWVEQLVKLKIENHQYVGNNKREYW